MITLTVTTVAIKTGLTLLDTVSYIRCLQRYLSVRMLWWCLLSSVFWFFNLCFTEKFNSYFTTGGGRTYLVGQAVDHVRETNQTEFLTLVSLPSLGLG